MAARSGMSTLVQDMRLMCELGTADYSVGGVSYWSDDQVQEELDKFRQTRYREPLQVESDYTDGTVTYQDYYWHKAEVEEYDASNAEIFHLEDSLGSVVGTADYTVNYEARHIRFDADTAGSAYYLTYRYYDINRVASRIWKKKAGHVANRFDIKSDNHDLKASQLVTHYLKMSKTFASAASPRSVKMVRSDMN